jgi:glycosyltransferase involved in cell wall biosynthesis
MKLIIQIPCFNEAEALPATLAELPRSVRGFDEVEWLVVNDGSTDSTVDTARRCGVDHVVSFKRNLGLSRAYVAGLKASLELGADVIVNTDADNQYRAADIPALVGPILSGRADIVIGARPINTIRHFSLLKKALQALGSAVVRSVSGTSVEDAPSGFRAVSREAAMRMHVFNEYTYTLETIIQAGRKNMVVVSVPVRVNKDVRPSRLVKSIPLYIKKSIFTMLRIFVVYRPFRFFMAVGGTVFAAGILVGLRFVVLLVFRGGGGGHVQSLILASILLGIGFQTMLTAFLADLLAVNRTLLEDIEFRAWKNADLAAQTGLKHRSPARVSASARKRRKNPKTL